MRKASRQTGTERTGKKQETKKRREAREDQESKLCLVATFKVCTCCMADSERHLVMGDGLAASAAEAGCCCSGN